MSDHSDQFFPSRRRALASLAAAATGLAAPAVFAQDAYPSRAITLIVPFAAGGVADITARTVAKAMSVNLKQTIVIDNRPSAGTIVGSSAVAHAAPDGYTLLLLSNGNAVSETLFKKLPFDVTRDFAPVGTLGFFDLGIFLDSKSRFHTVQDIVSYAKANPGKLTIGTIAVGSTQNLSAELFKTVTGIDAVIVPFNGTPAVLTALRAGQIDVSFEILSPLMAQVQAKVIRAAAVTGDKRFPLLPDVPTVQESGFPKYYAASWNALAAPAKTPPAVIARLNAAANEALKNKDVVHQLQSLAVTPKGSTPEELGTLLASEIKRWGDVIRAAKIEQQ